MSQEKDHFAYTVSMSQEKNTSRQMRNARYMGHYTQSCLRLDPAVNANKTISAGGHLVESFLPPKSPLVAMEANEDTKKTDLIKLPENLENLPKADEFPTKRNRWNTNEEILSLLLNFPEHDDWQSKEVVIRPESGSMLMYSRKKVRYRRDGYCWKKRKDGKTTREDHMKLKVQGVECIYGCYVHSAVLPTFHRRCYWLLQNPDIVLVHYLNVPYPDDTKLASLIPNIAFWTEKKEWTREELLLQLKPMYETPILESGVADKEAETEEAKLNRINQISSFIESMITQLLEKQRYVRAALTNSLECGCGNRKCLGAARCSRPMRRITSSKKSLKRTTTASSTKRNILKTTPIRKQSDLTASTRVQHTPNPTPYYGSASARPQMQQLPQSSTQCEASSQMNQIHDSYSSKLNQMTKQLSNNHSPENYTTVGDLSSLESRHYQSNFSTCPMVDTYVSNSEMELCNMDEKEININENPSTLMSYSTEEGEYTVDKYHSDTTDYSDSISYTTIHHEASPSNSFTSADGTDHYANGYPMDDLITSANSCHNYEASTDHNLYELIIQLTQKEKTTCSNSLVTCEELQQYGAQSETSGGYNPMFDNDANGNLLYSCPRYATSDENIAQAHANSSNFSRLDNNYLANYTNLDGNFTNSYNEFSTNERDSSSQEAGQSNPSCMIIDFAPEWSYCEGGTKLLIVGPWYFQSEYAILFDGYSVPATLVQAGILKCYCPEHAVGLVSLQVVSAGSIISNSVVFEYKKRQHYDDNVCHNTCNMKTEQCNQYMYENDTLLKFILIQRIESIQEDGYKCSSMAHVNKCEAPPEKAST